eukprot:4678956-Pleurochrysis_carterae.AAC.2
MPSTTKMNPRLVDSPAFVVNACYEALRLHSRVARDVQVKLVVDTTTKRPFALKIVKKGEDTRKVPVVPLAPALSFCLSPPSLSPSSSPHTPARACALPLAILDGWVSTYQLESAPSVHYLTIIRSMSFSNVAAPSWHAVLKHT